MSDSRSIGIFDSGIGGLTVIKELKKRLPKEDLIYFGDTAHVPYGTKSKNTVLRFSIDSILFLLKKDVKLIVVACNTASSTALSEIKRNFKVPIVGVIGGGVKEAVRVTKNKRIGVIGTRSTIVSLAYDKEIKKIDPQVKVFPIACPLFVPLVEEGWMRKAVTEEVAQEYLSPLIMKNIDTLILGCTHYPLLKSVIRKVLSNEVNLVDSAREVSRQVAQIVSISGLANTKRKKGQEYYYVSDEARNFAKVAGMFLGYSLKRVKKI